MFSPFHRRESDWRRGIAAGGASVSKAHRVRCGSWIERASAIRTNRDDSTSHMRQRLGDSLVGRAGYRRPTGQDRVGWEGTVH